MAKKYEDGTQIGGVSDYAAQAGTLGGVGAQKAYQPTSVGTKAAAGANLNPAGITQSYYTQPTNAQNYESGRPVYQQSQAVQDAATALQTHMKEKPGDYQSAYGDQIQGLIDGLLNREKFHYDFSADPLYQMYADQYQQNGQQAMKGAMAQSAALTGGYGNSYAQQVGQQTYQQYLSQMNNMIPELRNAAYQMYQDEGNNMRSNLGMLQTQDAADYGRYRDLVGDWQSDRNYLYGAYSDMSDREYNRFANDQQAWMNDRDYWYRKAYDEQQQANWQAQFDAQYGGKSGGGSGGGKKKAAKKTDQTPTTPTQSYLGLMKDNAHVINTKMIDKWMDTKKK